MGLEPLDAPKLLCYMHLESFLSLNKPTDITEEAKNLINKTLIMTLRLFKIFLQSPKHKQQRFSCLQN